MLRWKVPYCGPGRMEWLQSPPCSGRGAEMTFWFSTTVAGDLWVFYIASADNGIEVWKLPKGRGKRKGKRERSYWTTRSRRRKLRGNTRRASANGYSTARPVRPSGKAGPCHVGHAGLGCQVSPPILGQL